MQNAATDADSILTVLQLRLRKLRASAGEDLLTTEGMFELARRSGRAVQRVPGNPLGSQLPTVITLVLLLVIFRFLMKGTGAVLL